jgi:uncharacterized membrane protein YbhN (UPF0104 family)
MIDVTKERRVALKRLLQAAVSLAIVVGIFVGVLPQFASYSEVWATIRDMSGLELSTLGLIGVWNIVTYWFVMVAVLPGLRYREAAVVNQASTAVSNTLPAGGAIGVGVTYAMYTSWGFTTPEIALSAVVSGVWNNFVKLGMPVLAVVLLALTGDVTAARLTAAGAGLAVLGGTVLVFGMILKSERLAVAIGTRLGRIVSKLRSMLRRSPGGDWGASALGFRNQTVGLLKNRWAALTASTVISHTSLYIVLLLTLRHVGVAESTLGWVEILAAFAVVRLISALPITPGGLGIVEAGYTIALTVGVDAATRAQVVAAVLLFRAVTFFLPIPLGALAYTFWRRNRSWRKTPEERAATATSA